jgi:aerobic-type carbon monoxide dehydrogenase small subunit (CoxS/CutS family)
MRFELHVNARSCEVDVPAGTSLLGVLRDDLGLTGTRYGCGHGACGACFILVDGEPMAACTLSVEQASEKAIVTVEGLAEGEALHRAFLVEDAMQCGYCTSGMLISAVALLARDPRPSDDDVRRALAPHLCRCGVYLRALRAVKRAAL